MTSKTFFYKSPLRGPCRHFGGPRVGMIRHCVPHLARQAISSGKQKHKKCYISVIFFMIHTEDILILSCIKIR